MPKRVPEDAKRVPLNCLVAPETLAYLKAARDSQGVVVDRAVAALRMQQAQGRVETFKTTREAMEYAALHQPDVVKSVRRELRPPDRRPLLKPSEKGKK